MDNLANIWSNLMGSFGTTDPNGGTCTTTQGQTFLMNQSAIIGMEGAGLAAGGYLVDALGFPELGIPMNGFGEGFMLGGAIGLGIAAMCAVMYDY